MLSYTQALKVVDQKSHSESFLLFEPHVMHSHYSVGKIVVWKISVILSMNTVDHSLSVKII